jgi:hypothetical protein
LELKEIDEQVYIEFVKKHFNQENKVISDKLVSAVYNLFEGHTWYIQNVFNELYAITDNGETCTFELAQEAIENRIASYEPLFYSTLSLLSERQKEMLYAVAKDGKATAITSASFIKKHGLLSSSSVQTATKQLLDKEIITSGENVYQVYDRFFGLWLTTVFGTGYRMK